MAAEVSARAAGDLATARRLLVGLGEHARAFDASTATTTWTSETAQRHQRLTGLPAPPPSPSRDLTAPALLPPPAPAGGGHHGLARA
jgi:hypothetical protein